MSLVGPIIHSTLIKEGAGEMRKNRQNPGDGEQRAVTESTKPAAGTPTTGLWHKTGKIAKQEDLNLPVRARSSF
jgi:hypothetical protein